MISPITGAVSGVGVKFSHEAKWPSTKIHVKMPIVDPSVSALITVALIGSTSDPNARNINSVVVVNRMTNISGSLSKMPWMASCSSAGVPPTRTVRPLGAVMARNSLIFLAESFAFTNPFWITRTESSLGWVVPFGPATQGLPAIAGQGRSCQFLSVNPVTEPRSLRISATCWSVTFLWLSLSITTVSCWVR